MRTALLLLSIAVCVVCSVNSASLPAVAESQINANDIDLVGYVRHEAAAGEIVRQKRNPAVARALLTVAKRILRWCESRGIGEVTSTGLLVGARFGGFRQALRDFKRYVSESDILRISRFNNGRMLKAYGKDGSRMIVRSRSSDGQPTLEFQDATLRPILKIVYGPNPNIVIVTKRLLTWYASQGIGKVTSTGLRVVTKFGGFRRALRNFRFYVSESDIATVRTIDNGRVAIDRDGSRMVVRWKRSDGRPTLEFYDARGKPILKIVY